MATFWDAWYVHVPNHLLAAVICMLAGRFLLALLVPAAWDNTLWRGFCRLTDWAIVATGWITPRLVPRPLLVLLAAFWLFLLRGLFWIAMLAAGWAPLAIGGVS